jgi:hypothetical protein
MRVPTEDEIWLISRVTEASAEMTERVTQIPQKSTGIMSHEQQCHTAPY